MARRRKQQARARLVNYKDRPFGIRWEYGEFTGQISTGTNNRDKAAGEMALLLRDLEQGIIPGQEDEGPNISWADFRIRYQSEYLRTMSEGSWSGWTTAANHYERLLKPTRLSDLNKSAFSKLRGLLLEEGKAVSSIASYTRTLRAALGWAYSEELLRDPPPRIRARKGLRKRSGMRSRPITGEEFDRIVEAAKVERPKDYKVWQRFLKGLWESSLRVDELRRLTWDEGDDLSIDSSGKYPMIRMLAEGHKSGRDCFQPITPEFWALISKPGVVRRGNVFPLPGRKGQQMTRKRVIRVVSAIGKRAKVITGITTAKTATSHDIGRRAALTRLAGKMKLSQVQQWARHSDPRTTSEFYIRDEANALAEAVGWEPQKRGITRPHDTE